jgi:hypothetical protein
MYIFFIHTYYSFLQVEKYLKNSLNRLDFKRKWVKVKDDFYMPPLPGNTYMYLLHI